jgi:hypothetical protein
MWFAAVMLLSSKEPFGFSHLMVWIAALGGVWCLVKVVRTPAIQEVEPEPVVGDANTEQIPVGGRSILAWVLGTLVWAFIWAGLLAPLFGLRELPVKGHLIFIIGIPLGYMWVRDKVKSNRGDKGA